MGLLANSQTCYGLTQVNFLTNQLEKGVPDILKVFILAQSKPYFFKCCARKQPTSHIKVVKICKKIHVKIIKMHDFSSLSVLISRFCANSANFCAVARLHNGNIQNLWGVLFFILPTDIIRNRLVSQGRHINLYQILKNKGFILVFQKSIKY